MFFFSYFDFYLKILEKIVKKAYNSLFVEIKISKKSTYLKRIKLNKNCDKCGTFNFLKVR